MPLTGADCNVCFAALFCFPFSSSFVLNLTFCSTFKASFLARPLLTRLDKASGSLSRISVTRQSNRYPAHTHTNTQKESGRERGRYTPHGQWNQNPAPGSGLRLKQRDWQTDRQGDRQGNRQEDRQGDRQWDKLGICFKQNCQQLSKEVKRKPTKQNKTKTAKKTKRKDNNKCHAHTTCDCVRVHMCVCVCACAVSVLDNFRVPTLSCSCVSVSVCVFCPASVRWRTAELLTRLTQQQLTKVSAGQEEGLVDGGTAYGEGGEDVAAARGGTASVI